MEERAQLLRVIGVFSVFAQPGDDHLQAQWPQRQLHVCLSFNLSFVALFVCVPQMAEGTPRTYQHCVAECVVNAVRVNGEFARGQTVPRDLTCLSLLAVHGLVDLKRYFNFGMETLPNG